MWWSSDYHRANDALSHGRHLVKLRHVMWCALNQWKGRIFVRGVIIINILVYRYFILSMDFETYYPVSPPQPLWAHAFYDKIAELKPKRLPLTDIQMHEQWKKKYGYHQAIKYKVWSLIIEIIRTVFKQRIQSTKYFYCKVSGTKFLRLLDLILQGATTHSAATARNTGANPFSFR